MPSIFPNGPRKAPSGLPCINCGVEYSATWRGVGRRLCSRTATGCKQKALAEAAACKPCEPSDSAVETKPLLPLATTSAAINYAWPYNTVMLVMAEPLTASMAKLPTAAKPLLLGTVVLAPPAALALPPPTSIALPLAEAMADAASAEPELPAAEPPVRPQEKKTRPAARKPLGCVDGNAGYPRTSSSASPTSSATRRARSSASSTTT